jgi:hypothetical protein
MTKLITYNDFAPYRAISANVDSTKRLEPYIEEAQMFDLKPVLDCQDEEFLAEIITGKDDSPYKELIVYIKPVLVYYTYARFLATHDVMATAHGIVTKTNEFSEPISEKTRARLIAQAESSALVYQKIMTDFLSDNKSDYPNWKCASTSGRTQSGARIKAIGGSSSYPSAIDCPEEGIGIL